MRSRRLSRSYSERSRRLSRSYSEGQEWLYRPVAAPRPGGRDSRHRARRADSRQRGRAPHFEDFRREWLFGNSANERTLLAVRRRDT